MYHVFFDRRPTRPRLPHALYEQLTALPPNVEINVHTANETHYNALFLGFEPRTNNVSLLVDRFYKDEGRSLTIDAATITAIDLPVSMRPASSVDPDDEEE
ncbi:hypothetical protein RA955_06835 [Geobacillus proteiniphilus]|uniref:Uncharacterized protein n=1 Tax=Geobacillus proteiniphilus TaxID=860353 RepID=A0A1Q5SYX4_9BACL|nr:MULTISPECIES: hypothetical protein [Geobacillus]MED4972086.1 hypothetical protein [Geobacillus thermoleovorans]OKO93173.1 hypothetical protein BRO54_2005 [Geobacillus proteiniphilus]QCK82186.1 hypothetical protein E5Z46_07885 [Geobacillus kaustophilus NBRC 102445]WMJ17755.1 hypothetical protein RA955_06835 [Geobacillus proteiniphilus]